MISVTEIACKKIKSNLTRRGQGVGIRLGVRTTGCSGLAYVLEYVDNINSEDITVEQDGFVAERGAQGAAQPYRQSPQVEGQGILHLCCRSFWYTRVVRGIDGGCGRPETPTAGR